MHQYKIGNLDSPKPTGVHTSGSFVSGEPYIASQVVFDVGTVLVV